MLTQDFELMVSNVQLRKKKDGGTYCLVRVVGDDGKSIDLYNKEMLDLKIWEKYIFNLTISITDGRAYVNINEVSEIA